MTLLIRDARVPTCATAGPVLRRTAPRVFERADVVVDGDRIAAVTPSKDDGTTGLERLGSTIIEARGRVLLPAFVDAHTHACWAGDRLDEYELKRKGASYLEILKAGGGIMSTVRAVRAATQAQLTDLLRARLDRMLREGTTTVEIKSGYGLTTPDELKMLRAIADAAARWPGTVVQTALLGHAIDPDQPDFVRRTIEETLPAVHKEFPGIAVDAYCEKGAWSPDECRALFERASSFGHAVRVHADQFNSLGMTAHAVGIGARSVDHLEATTPADLALLAQSETFGVLLPCAGFGTDDRYANGRAFIDAGGKAVVATNCNPGSAPCSSMPFAVALAVRKCGMTAAEAIAGCTANAAALLGLADRGAIEPGMRADFVLLGHTDERMLGYEFGGDPVDGVVCAGEVVKLVN